MGIFDNFLQQLGTGDQVKDFKHANRLFVNNNYALSPKYTWLFHVFFDINPMLSRVNTQKQIETGLLVRSADLPKFKVDTKTYNNYNRPAIAQSKIRYEDINITFHDDSSDVIRNFWYDYYDFYYRDMDNSYGDPTGAINPIYGAPNKQRLGQRTQFNKFGYSPRSPSSMNMQYLQAIRIYSLHQKRFSEYTLINPIINSFRHGTHTNGSDSTMEHSMSISYETVLYATGWAQTARGFAQLHYDKSPSPLTPAGGGTNSFAGPGGILNTISEVIGDAGGGNFGSALFKAARGYQKNKNVDLKGLAAAELTTAFVDLASGRSPLNRTFVPYRNGAVDNRPGSPTELKGTTAGAAGSISSNGSSLTLGQGLVLGGVATALAGEPVLGAGIAIAGLIASSNTASKGNTVQGGATNSVVNLSSNAAIAAAGINALTAVSSDPLPLFSFAAAIAKRNEEVKAKENAEAKKRVEAQGDAYKAYYSSGAGAKPTSPTYETGTNNTVSSTSAPTPDSGKSYSASTGTANQSASDTISKQGTAAGYAPSGSSTNPTPPQQVTI